MTFSFLTGSALNAQPVRMENILLIHYRFHCRTVLREQRLIGVSSLFRWRKTGSLQTAVRLITDSHSKKASNSWTSLTGTVSCAANPSSSENSGPGPDSFFCLLTEAMPIDFTNVVAALLSFPIHRCQAFCLSPTTQTSPPLAAILHGSTRSQTRTNLTVGALIEPCRALQMQPFLHVDHPSNA